MSHDVHLVEMNLWNVGVGGRVDAFRGHHGDYDGFRLPQASLGDTGVDVGDGGDGNVVDRDDVAIA